MNGEEPTIVVVFTSRRSVTDEGEYAEMSARLAEQVESHPGFVKKVSFRDPSTREGVTIAWFTGDDAVKAWKAHPEHVHAQRRGVESFYEEYQLTVAEISREYGWTRP